MAKVATNYRFTTDEKGNVRIAQTTDAATLTPIPTSKYLVEEQEADAVSFFASSEEVVRGTGNARKLLARMIAMKANAVAEMLREEWDDVPAPKSSKELEEAQRRASVAWLDENTDITPTETIAFLIDGTLPSRVEPAFMEWIESQS